MLGRKLLWILAGALVARVIVAVVWTPALVTDASDYFRLANGLLSGDGFVNTNGAPTSWRPPGYPAFVAAVLGLGQGNLLWIRLSQALLATVSVGLVYALGRRSYGESAGLIAASLVAINLGHVFAVSRVLSETVFAMLFLLGTWCLQQSEAESGRDRAQTPALAWAAFAWAAFAGVAWGAATLVRGILLPYVPLVGLVLLWRRGFNGRSLGIAAALGVAFLTTLAPWAARNAEVHDAFVPVATQVGATLYAGNHPRDGLVFGVMAEDERTAAAESMKEPEASSFLVSATVEDWLANPGALPRLLFLKMAYFWVPADWEILPWYGVFNPTYALLLVGMLGILPFGQRWGDGGPQDHSLPEPNPSAPEDASSAPAPSSIWLLWLPIGFFVLVGLVFYGSPRLRLPVEPFFALIAAEGFRRLATRLGPQRSKRLAAGLGLSLAAGMVFWGVTADILRSGLALLAGAS